MIQFVGAGPGDVELITVKGLKALQRADCVIYAGSLVDKGHLEVCSNYVRIYDSASMTLDEVIQVMVEMEKQNLNTVRLHTGDPSLYGAIREQMDALNQYGLPYEVIPGVSSFLGAAAVLKEELTLPEISQTVIITRLPGRTGVSEGGELRALAKHQATMAIFLSIQAIEEVVKELLEGYTLSTPVAVVYKATWEDQLIVRGTLRDISQKVHEAGIKRHAMIFVGEFMGNTYGLSKLYDENFTHGYREGLPTDEQEDEGHIKDIKKKGQLYAVGIGPGDVNQMTYRAQEVLRSCDRVVGYQVYVDQVKSLIGSTPCYANTMGQERIRCEAAITFAQEGERVAVVCSGDAGLYGMAGLLFECLDKQGLSDVIEVEVVPGVTSALACSSLLGAPIVEDFCTISLSDYMTPYEKILNRVKMAAMSDFTIVLYNPKSKKRPSYLKQVIELLLEHYLPEFPVGIVKQAYRDEEVILRTTLGHIPYESVDMFTTLIIGNSKSRWIGDKFVTSRGYAL